MKRRIVLVVICMTALLISELSYARERDADSNSYVVPGAVDAKGALHWPDKYPRPHLPWMDDKITNPLPDYPNEDRRDRHEGRGLYRLTLDLKTGSVTNVTVIVSTGFRTLDGSAVASFHRWRWKPGKWKEVDVPVTFRLSYAPREPRPWPWGEKQLNYEER